MLVTKSTTSLPRSIASLGLWVLWWSWFGARLDVRFWLVVNDWFCLWLWWEWEGEGQCERELRERLKEGERKATRRKREHLLSKKFFRKSSFNTCLQRQLIIVEHFLSITFFQKPSLNTCNNLQKCYHVLDDNNFERIIFELASLKIIFEVVMSEWTNGYGTGCSM